MDGLAVILGIVGALTGIVGVIISCLANKHSNEANRIAREALDLQQESDKLKVEIGPLTFGMDSTNSWSITYAIVNKSAFPIVVLATGLADDRSNLLVPAFLHEKTNIEPRDEYRLFINQTEASNCDPVRRERINRVLVQLATGEALLFPDKSSSLEEFKLRCGIGAKG